MIKLSKGLNLNEVNNVADKYHKIKRTKKLITDIFNKKAITILISIAFILNLSFTCFADNIPYQHNLRQENVRIIGINKGYVYTTEGWAIDKRDIQSKRKLKKGMKLLVSYYANDLLDPNDDDFVQAYYQK